MVEDTALNGYCGSAPGARCGAAQRFARRTLLRIRRPATPATVMSMFMHVLD